MTDEQTAEGGGGPPQRLTVSFSPRTYGVLWAMKQELNVPLVDVIRESIAVMWRVFNHLKAGGQVILRHDEGDSQLFLPGQEQGAGRGRGTERTG